MSSYHRPTSHSYVLFLRKWNGKYKSGIEKGFEDIRIGNVFHTKDSQDLILQILG